MMITGSGYKISVAKSQEKFSGILWMNTRRIWFMWPIAIFQIPETQKALEMCPF
jgi:hypothetical protein